VGTGNATSVIKDGDLVTVSCAEGETGVIYEGKLKWSLTELDLSDTEKPETKVMYILGDPDQAFQLSRYPNDGVGLMRLEFIITNAIKIHPMALVRYNSLKDLTAKKEIESLTVGYTNKENYFVDTLARAVGTIAAAFYPKDVIVRMSDFKTNEYANLLGGKEFEPKEENPMIGFRGASRYYHNAYKEGFGLECKAMKVVRDEMGLNNVKLMIPFCRTVEEGKKVIQIMEEHGLKQNVNGLEIYVMAEIPSNVILASDFAKIFDGFSIGSNDLTQLTLGIDRDSSTISHLFDENNEAPKRMIKAMILSAKKAGRKIGLCGQAPSDFPAFAEFLVECGIDSISFNPDALTNGIVNIVAAEKKRNKKPEVKSIYEGNADIGI
jgi:pyruvate,water dikinase